MSFVSNLVNAAWGNHEGSGATLGAKPGQGQSGLPPMKPPKPAKFSPLQTILAQYPHLTAPGITNVSMQHMQAMAQRANTSAGRNSALRDFLAGS